MVSSIYQESSSTSTVVDVPIRRDDEPAWRREGDCTYSAREERTDANWFVRVVLTANPDMTMQSVRVIVDDRDAQRLLLHTVWTDWQAVPILADTVAAGVPLAESLEATAWDVAAALLMALQRDAEGCLEQLGVSAGQLPAPRRGPQERAAMRNVNDAVMRWRRSAMNERK